MSILYSLMQIPGLGSLAGVSVVITLVWYIGPLLSIGGHSPLASPRNQLILTLVLIAGWGLYMLGRWLLARRKNAQMTRKLAEGPVADATTRSAEQLKIIRKTFDDALKHLRNSRIGKRGQYLYQLPWYLIIGPPGSGKTTALVHSGLKFPLQNRLKTSKFKGIGGTRNCDWFVSDEAVLIDTAGRFFTHDSEQDVDQKVWQGFLKLMRQFRRRSPVNGAFIAVSLHDLMTRSDIERAEIAEVTNQRIQELHRTLGTRFPIYILFTKADLVAGFVEFFADLKGDERQQVWGVTWPLTEDASHELPWQEFGESFDALEHRLHLRLIDRLQTERDPLSRDRIYTFPQQLRTLRQTAESFLREALQPDPLEPELPWMIRGVYFTSGTQQGNPINQMIQQFAGALGLKAAPLPRFGGKGKSYFLNRLLREVVFPESGLSSANQRAERRLKQLRIAGYLAVAVIGVGLAGLWLWSYGNNSSLITSTAAQTTTVEDLANRLGADDTSLSAVLPALDAAVTLPGLGPETAVPTAWSRNFGLEQGHKLAEAARTGYGQLLETGLLPRVILYLEDHLRSLLDNSDQKLVEVAIAYRLLDNPGQLREQQAAFLATVEGLLDEDVNLDETQVAALKRHLRVLITQVELPTPLRPLALDQALLARIGPVLGDPQTGLTPVVNCQGPTVTELLGNQGSTVFLRDGGTLAERVPCLYTQQGFQEAQQGGTERALQAARTRIIAAGGDPGQLNAAEIQARYLADYRDYWAMLLDDLRLVCANDSNDIDRIGGVLTGSRSSIRRLFEAVAMHTGVDPTLQAAFSRIHDLVATPEEGVALLESLLMDLEAALRLPVNAEDPRAAMRQRASNLASFSTGIQEPHLREWIASLAEEQRFIAERQGSSPGINQMWESPKNFCVSHIDGHQPFAAGGAKPVIREHFESFFGPGGKLANFVRESHIGSFCQQGTMDLVRGDAQRQFCRGIEIMEAYFPGNRQQPAHDIVNPADTRVRALVSGFRCPRCL